MTPNSTHETDDIPQELKQDIELQAAIKQALDFSAIWESVNKIDEICQNAKRINEDE